MTVLRTKVRFLLPGMHACRRLTENKRLMKLQQDLLAAADIGEMLLEKNRALNQKIAELESRLDDQVWCTARPCTVCCCGVLIPEQRLNQ